MAHSFLTAHGRRAYQHRRRQELFTVAGPVTIHRADGAVEVQPPYGHAALDRIVRGGGAR